MFDFVKLARAIKDENVGKTLAITLVFSFAFGLMIYAYQPFALKILHLTPSQIALNFTAFGIIGLIAQAFIIPKTSKRWAEKTLLVNSLILSMLAFFGLFVSRNYIIFIFFSMLLSLGNAFVNPLIQSLLSKETDERSQGEIMGVNASYLSIGTIFGPIIGGILATLSVPMPFFGGSIFVAFCVVIAYQILKKPAKTISLE